MDADQFRKFGKEVVDFIAEYLENIRDCNVLPSVDPGYLIKKLPKEAPEQPENWKDVMNDIADSIIPGLTHWQSPQFHAFYPAGHSYASVLGSMLTDGLSVVGLNWMASPACTELEIITMNWLGKLIDLPEQFLNCSPSSGGGVLQGSASESTLITLLVAKDKTVRYFKNKDSSLEDDYIKSKLVAYSSDQSNSSVEKAGQLGSMKMRLLKSDANGRLRGETLRKAIAEDKDAGLIPCYVVATLGTTATCAFDPLHELGPICCEYNIWMHVDAAYAGPVFVCPEYRHLMKGVEYADSIVLNPHKWMLVNFECSALWLKDGQDIMNAFEVKRIYLEDTKNNLKIPDYRHWQIPLGRRFKSLKLWTVMRLYGAEGLRKHFRGQISLALYFSKLVGSDDRFLIEPEPSMGLVCFRLKDGDILTEQLLNNLTKKKKIYMVAGSFRNQFIIRFVVSSPMTTEEDINYSWSVIREETDFIYANKVHAKATIPAIDEILSRKMCEKYDTDKLKAELKKMF